MILIKFYVLWHDTDKREMFVTDCENALKAKKDIVKPILVKSYLTLEKAIKGDMEQWRKFNK